MPTNPSEATRIGFDTCNAGTQNASMLPAIADAFIADINHPVRLFASLAPTTIVPVLETGV
jgi:hypothetical protein